MAEPHLSLAYLRIGLSKNELDASNQALRQRISTLRPNIDSLETRRRVRRTPNEIQKLESNVSESISAYRSSSRGQQPYCRSRALGYSSGPYHRPSLGRPCNCGNAHKVPNPKEWKSSLAEASEWDYELPNGGHSVRKSKVTFADPIVTEVREMERWYADTYGAFSSRGIVNDTSTEADDAREMQMLDATDTKSAEIVQNRESRGRKSTRAGSAVRPRSKELRKESISRDEA